MISVKILLIVLVYSTVANAFELKCKYSIKSEYSCDVQSLQIDLPHTKITRVSGDHLEDNENEDVKYLGITDQSIKFLPINLAQYFTNLKKIQVKNSKLEYITKNDFLGLTQLTHLVMGNNIIKELPCGVFDTNKRLQQLYFTDNDLQKIGKDILKHLPLLSLAHFRKNTCIDKDVDKIEGVPGLTNEIAKKCNIGCEKTGDYPPAKQSCDSEYYQTVINELGNTVYTLSYKVENLESNLSDLKEDIEKLEEDKDELNEKLEDLEMKQLKIIEDAKQKDEELNSIISNKDDDISENKEEIKNLENIVTNITAINEELTTNLSEFLEKNINLTNDKVEMLDKITELETNITQITDDAQQAEVNLNMIINDKENNIIANSKEIKTLGETVDSLEKDLDASKMENLQINNEKDELNKKISVLGIELSKSIEEAKENDQKLNNIITNKDKNISKNNEDIKKLNINVNVVTASNKNLQKNLAASKAENVKLNKNKSQLQQNIKGLETRIKKAVDDAKLSEKNLRLIISNKDKVLNKNKNDIKTLQNKVKVTSEINGSLNKDLNASIAETVMIKKSKEELNQYLKELEVSYNQTMEDAKKTEEELKETIDSKEIQIVGLESNIQNINDTLKTTDDNWTVRCLNDDRNICYSKNFSIAVETSYDYTNLKSFYEYKTDTDFRIENSKMTNLSNSFFKHYPNLRYFFVTASQLKSLKNGNFIDAGQLLQITITRNQIRYIEDSTFEGAKNVEIMNLAHNRIENLANKALAGLKKLKELNLSNNKIRSLKQDFFSTYKAWKVFTWKVTL